MFGCSWYHGTLDRHLAEVKLVVRKIPAPNFMRALTLSQGKPDGVFLLRDSTSMVGGFVLSVRYHRAPRVLH